MKKLYKTSLLCVVSALSLLLPQARAQVSAYLFAQSNGTYIPITGGTVVATATANTAPGNLAATSWNLPNGTIPFPFMFNGNNYTGCYISCNGYISFGTVAPTLGTPISGATAYDGAISAWGRTNNGAFSLGTTAPFYTSELRMEVIGSAPNRTFVVQFDNWRYSSGTGTTAWLLDFQIRLIETINVVEIVYGSGVMAGGSLTTGGFNVQVGLRGATNTDFNNRSSAGPFDTSTPGTANNANQAFAISGGIGVIVPASGLTYKWYPSCGSISSAVTPSATVNLPVICEGDTIKLNATGETPYIDISYQWQQSSNPNGPFTNVTSPSGTVFSGYHEAATTGTLYYVLVTTCTSVPYSAISNTIAVDVRPKPIISIVSSPTLNTSVSPIETCFGETYTLKAGGAFTYTWVNGPVNNDTYVVQPSGNPSYTVTGTSVDWCEATRVLSINVNPLPLVSVLSTPNAICPGETVVLGVTGNAVTYTWTAQNSTSFLITDTPTVNTTYSVTGTSAMGCTATAVHPVLVHNVTPLNIATLGGTNTICKGSAITLSASGASTYTWTTPGTYTTGPFISSMPEVTTVYTLTGNDANGCATQATFEQSVSACTGLNAITDLQDVLNVYPNPNNGVFMLTSSNELPKHVVVTDITGKTVLSATFESETEEINISGFSAGVYYVAVRTGNSSRTIKVVKH